MTTFSINHNKIILIYDMLAQIAKRLVWACKQLPKACTIDMSNIPTVWVWLLVNSMLNDGNSMYQADNLTNLFF